MSYKYNSAEPIKVKLSSLTVQQQFLLRDSKTFCIYPWIHLHTYPTGQTYPCCHADMNYPVGDAKENTLNEITCSKDMCRLRKDMLAEKMSKECQRCYEQEEAGFFSGRKSANKHHGHHIDLITDRVYGDGVITRFKMTYWDIRFSNLCNLSCRSCGHIFSSQWYSDQAELADGDWKEHNKSLNIAGRFKGDMLEQVLEHIDDVEQIYFAGGEPLIMDEHYYILEELEKRKRFDVRLIYNTNFTRVNLKDRLVFDYWKKFDSVSVGASLDAMGPRAEYIRKGTKWADVEYNRKRMLEICPNVDFYVSATLSILNALHLPNFHKDWVAKGFIKPQDFNINILQDPQHYRIDVGLQAYKDKIKKVYQEHIEWLKEQDHLERATNGFQSAIKFLAGNNNELQKFWQKTNQLDAIRNESILDFIPEIKEIL
jgi:organic radical activating enzyme